MANFSYTLDQLTVKWYQSNHKGKIPFEYSYCLITLPDTIGPSDRVILPDDIVLRVPFKSAAILMAQNGVQVVQQDFQIIRKSGCMNYRSDDGYIAISGFSKGALGGHYDFKFVSDYGASGKYNIGPNETVNTGYPPCIGVIITDASNKYVFCQTFYDISIGTQPPTGMTKASAESYVEPMGETPGTCGVFNFTCTFNNNTLKWNNWSKLYSTDNKQISYIDGVLYDPDDPYDGGDDPGDGDNTPGDYDHKSDPVPEPDLPSVSVTDSGLVTLFAPTETQLKSLADYLWSDAFSLDSFKKMLNNPMDCILGLSIVPVNVPRGSAREITVGNIVTTVSCDICPTQYVKVDCGTFTFDRHKMTNSYLDYSPYSKCYLYLPFIGVQEINIDDFMQSTMHVVYHVDILTGAMFCYVMRGNNVMYTYMGQCAENVPLSSSSYSNTIGSIMSAAASIVGVASMAATGGATAPVAAGLLAGATTSTANAVTSLKPSVAHSGSIGGGAGIMGVNYPYLIFNTPHISIPSQQRHYTGYPSNQIVKLSALKGFNVIQAINLSVSGANDAEMNEIESILKGGVIL